MGMQFSRDDRAAEVRTQRTNRSAVRSHQSYEQGVRYVCHHSGKYLTNEENNPATWGFLREQHDFPGFPELDRRFQSAAHAREYQHLIWSKAGAEGVGLLLGALLLLWGAWLVAGRRHMWSNLIEFGFIHFFVLMAGFGALVMIISGVLKLIRRNDLYHQEIKDPHPCIDDFPLFGSYAIYIHEQYELELANNRRELPSFKNCKAEGSIRVDVMPEPDSPDIYREYCNIYAPHIAQGLGAYLFAGVIALEGRQSVSFKTPIDYEHRLILRQPTTERFVVAGKPQRELLSFETKYNIGSTILCTETALHSESEKDRGRSKISITPELELFDSYTLNVMFLWHGNPIACFLDECKLEIPPEYGTVAHVQQGHLLGTEVVWRHKLFKPVEESKLDVQTLTLTVRFTKPVLASDDIPPIVGSYRLMFEQAISGLHVSPEQIWDAMGKSVIHYSHPSVIVTSVVQGSLIADIAVLAQEHEYVAQQRFATQAAPTGDLIRQIVAVLTEALDVNIQRIKEAMPRLDPQGSLKRQLHYWDILGRKYINATLEALDVHVVVSGSTAHETSEKALTRIDLRLRCLYDPRNPEITQHADRTCQIIYNEICKKINVVEDTVSVSENKT